MTGEDDQKPTSTAEAQARVNLELQNEALGTIAAVAVKLPKFWPQNLSVWFSLVEAQFRNARVTTDQTKFDHVLGVIDQKYAELCSPVLENLPNEGKYEALKNFLLSNCVSSVLTRAKQLLDFPPAADRSGIEIAADIRNLTRGQDVESIAKAVFLNSIPQDLALIIASSPGNLQDWAAKYDELRGRSISAPAINAVES